jgi:arabinogalactan oligomer/maltooligosaccharide transport system permease protein
MKDRLPAIGAHVALIFASVVALYPVLWVLKVALSPKQTLDASPNIIPTSITMDNFISVTSQHDSTGAWLFGHQLWNSIMVSLATTIVGILLACTAAYAFSRFRFPGRQAGMAAFLLTQIFPGVVMLIPIYILLDTMGLLDSLLGLVLVYSTTAVPFSTWMLKGYFDTLPKELEEAAVMDGASSWIIFWKIMLPLARPAVAVTALFSFMTAWNEFILAATLINDAKMFTLPVALQRYVGEFQTDWGSFAAGAIIVSVPVMLVFYALQKHLVGGLTAGSVKG